MARLLQAVAASLLIWFDQFLADQKLRHANAFWSSSKSYHAGGLARNTFFVYLHITATAFADLLDHRPPFANDSTDVLVWY